MIFAPLALVFGISAGRNSMSASTTRLIFLAFAALMGLSLSTVFVVFTQASIALVFFETAAAFGGLSLYGYTTSRSLSAMGSFLVMGLFGLIIASVVNLFLQSSGLQWALSIVGIGIFAGLTAWDTQAIKEATSPATPTRRRRRRRSSARCGSISTSSTCSSNCCS